MKCVLCGREVKYGTLDIRPGDMVRCELHIWKDLGPWGTFTPEEARQEGEKRVLSLSPTERKQEGLIAYVEIEKWEQELNNRKVYGELRQFTLDLIAAKKAYLSAFD